MKKEPIPAKDVALHYTSVKISLTAIVVGPAMIKPLKELWNWFQIIQEESLEQKLYVSIVEDIKVMYSMTAPLKLGCVIV
jgi:hypothetical protein